MITTITVLYFLAAGFKSSFSLLLPFIAKDIHLSLSQVGLLGSLTSAVGILVAVPAAYIGNKFGSIRVLVFTFLIVSLGFFGIALTHSFYFLFLLFLCVGIGFGLFLSLALAVLTKSTEKATRGRQLGNFSAAADIGRLLLGAGITFLAGYIGWNFTASIYGVIAFVVFIVIYLKYLHKNIHINKLQDKTPDTSTLKHYLKNTNFVLVNIAGSLDVLASASIFMFLPFLLIHKGFDVKVIGLFSVAYFLGSFGGKTIIGRLVDMYGNKKLFILCEFGMAICIIAIILSSSLPIIICLSIILGSLSRGTVPASLSILAETLEQHGRYEKGLGLNTLIINIASTCGPLLLGFISDKFGINQAFFASACIVLVATVPVFIMLKLKTVKST